MSVATHANGRPSRKKLRKRKAMKCRGFSEALIFPGQAELMFFLTSGLRKSRTVAPLARFRFGAFFQSGFARELYAAFVVDADAFDPNHVADVRHIFGALYPEVGQLGNMDETVSARENFDKGAEFFDGDNPALLGLPNLDFARHAADNFCCPRHALPAGGVDALRAIVLDVTFSPG